MKTTLGRRLMRMLFSPSEARARDDYHRSISDHLRRDIGLPECGSVGRVLRRHEPMRHGW